MRVVFLGGASGVGASCIAICVGERWVLVDAGVRVDRAADRLPDLAFLDGKQLAAVFVTHAHADHIGALPLVHQSFPDVPIYASGATVRLMEVMLADATRVMGRRAAEELEVPLYDERLVRSTLRALRPVSLSGSFSVPQLPGVTLYTSRAGHIAGAMMVGLDSPEGRIVVSGDVSVSPQRTVSAALLPELRHPDLFVLESTYGARSHPNRRVEEQRLARAVAEGVQRGHVLIPSFALGRAQELVLILRAAQRNGLIPEFPVWVDGLVRSVCSSYQAIPEALSPSLAGYILRGGKPFFGGAVRAVETPRQREAVLEGEPCCIIASSGMLTGGPSAYYAARLAENPDASIFITGYQDEEAPGRRLLELAERGEGQLQLEGRTVAVRCRVGKYALSAHADGGELLGLAGVLGPRAVALVHGDAEARATLAARLTPTTEVLLPQDGDELDLLPGQPGGRRISSSAPAVVRPEGLGGGSPLDLEGLERLWKALGDGTGVQVFGLRELARAWWGPGVGDSEEWELERVLCGVQPFFGSLPGVPGVYRLLSTAEMRKVDQGASTGPARPDQMAILAVVDRYLGQAPDLYHRGVDPQSGAVTLQFHFPQVAQRRYKETIELAAAEAGVEICVYPQPHQGALADAARACLPTRIRAVRSPSLLFDHRVVRVRYEGEAEPAELEGAKWEFQEATGWGLELIRAHVPATSPGAVVESGGISARLNLQASLSVAADLLGPETGCYKVGANQQAGVLLLRFHFPDVARVRYAGEIARLAEATGWRVSVHPAPHQGALEECVRSVLPQGFVPLGAPSLHQGRREVVVRCEGMAEGSAMEAASEAFEEATGWRLMLRTDAIG